MAVGAFVQSFKTTDLMCTFGQTFSYGHTCILIYKYSCVNSLRSLLAPKRYSCYCCCYDFLLFLVFVAFVAAVMSALSRHSLLTNTSMHVHRYTGTLTQTYCTRSYSHSHFALLLRSIHHCIPCWPPSPRHTITYIYYSAQRHTHTCMHIHILYLPSSFVRSISPQRAGMLLNPPHSDPCIHIFSHTYTHTCTHVSVCYIVHTICIPPFPRFVVGRSIQHYCRHHH